MFQIAMNAQLILETINYRVATVWQRNKGWYDPGLRFYKVFTEILGRQGSLNYESD